ncbi:MAG: trypsin-like peptidase domain-containing protein, partial [Kiritimatiellae bacterium]|nr:trypsin-like peptidase domain-containing protein [Kiritimatiellia bacterium]
MSFKLILAIYITVLAHISFPATGSSNFKAGENYFKAGQKHLDTRNEDSAFRAFKRAAYAGHVGGMRFLALCYIEGIGCWVDQDEGAYWLECAANHGDGFSALELAKIHFRKGRSVKGIDMLQKAAEAFAQQENQQGLVNCAQLAMDVGAKELAVAIYEISSGNSNTPNSPVPCGGTGTAWFVNETDVITCNHVIEGCNTFSLIDNNDNKSKLRLIATDEKNDLAVLRISSSAKLRPENVLTIKMYSELSVRKGGTCFTLGFPQPGIQGSSCKYTEGKINALEGVQGTKSHYQISAEIHPGNS